MIEHDEITQRLADYESGRLSNVTTRELISLMRNERDALRTQLWETQGRLAKYAAEAESWKDRTRDRAKKLAKAEAARDKLVGQLNDLINDSHGVSGLHLNGDEAPWDWLIDNGWLAALAEIEKD